MNVIAVAPSLSKGYSRAIAGLWTSHSCCSPMATASSSCTWSTSSSRPSLGAPDPDLFVGHGDVGRRRGDQRTPSPGLTQQVHPPDAAPPRWRGILSRRVGFGEPRPPRPRAPRRWPAAASSNQAPNQGPRRTYKAPLRGRRAPSGIVDGERETAADSCPVADLQGMPYMPWHTLRPNHASVYLF